jgi:hypothetical protein
VQEIYSSLSIFIQYKLNIKDNLFYIFHHK